MRQASCVPVGARVVSPIAEPTPTAVAVPVVPVVEASPPTQSKLIDELLMKKTLNTFTPVATQEATPEPSVPTLKELLLKVRPTSLLLHCHMTQHDSLTA